MNHVKINMMENNPQDNNLIYVPNALTGEHLFDGMPCPTIEAHDLIGDEGVESIRRRINQMVEWKKTMFGTKYPERYGFGGKQAFVDIQNKIILSVGDTIQNKIAHLVDEVGEENALQFYPSLVVSDEYAKKNYEKLISENHYIIEVYGQHDVSKHPTISIADYYRNHYR